MKALPNPGTPSARILRPDPCTKHGPGLLGTRCPCSLPCPECGANPGAHCKRPSGHEADEMHRRRALAAEFVDSLTGHGYHARDYSIRRLAVPPFAQTFEAYGPEPNPRPMEERYATGCRCCWHPHPMHVGPKGVPVPCRVDGCGCTERVDFWEPWHIHSYTKREALCGGHQGRGGSIGPELVTEGELRGPTMCVPCAAEWRRIGRAQFEIDALRQRIEIMRPYVERSAEAPLGGLYSRAEMERLEAELAARESPQLLIGAAPPAARRLEPGEGVPGIDDEPDDERECPDWDVCPDESDPTHAHDIPEGEAYAEPEPMTPEDRAAFLEMPDRPAYVERVDLWGNVTSTYQTEAELNGHRPTQGVLL